MAIYECRACENEEFIPRQYTFHLGDNARCPRCGTLRITRLRGPDKIDPMAPGLLNGLEKLAGGSLHHCCFCRLQFYDRRKMAPRTTLEPIQPDQTSAETAPASAEATEPPGTASWDE